MKATLQAAIMAGLILSHEVSADNLDVTLLIIPIEGVSSEKPEQYTTKKNGLIIDGIYELIRKHYPGNINYKATTPNRLGRELAKSTSTNCIHSVRNTTFDDTYNFALIGPMASFRFIYNKSLVKNLPLIDGMVDMDAVIASRDYQGVAIRGKHYSDSISPYVAKGIRSGSIGVISAPNLGSSLIDMLVSGRFAYTIDHPILLQAHKPETTDSIIGDAMIYQDSGIYEFGLYCSKSANSEAVTHALNSAMRDAIQFDQGEYRRLAGMVDAGAQSGAYSAALEAYIHERDDVKNSTPSPLARPDAP